MNSDLHQEASDKKWTLDHLLFLEIIFTPVEVIGERGKLSPDVGVIGKFS